MSLKNSKHILVVDDEPKIRNIIQDILQHEGYIVKTAKDGEDALKIISTEAIDLVLLDLVMPGMDGMEVLKQIFERTGLISVIIISAHGSIPLAVEATQLGAIDFIEKPIEMNHLLSTVERNLSESVKNHEQRHKVEERFERYGFIGIGHALDKVYHGINQAAPVDVRVLITGETGTGKELVAKAIHRLSKRSGKPFVKVNCAAIPAELIESELFGYRKGAFTGAFNDRVGKFQSAHQGTLFLDEIGDMSPMTQAKILRALEEKEIQPVGSTESVDVDVRLLSATNKNLEEYVMNGQFREDLYYRLNVVSIHLPLLSERKEDIPYLIDFFISGFCEEHNRKKKHLTKRAYEFLIKRDWPGNIRELRNFIERLVVIISEEIIDLSHVRALFGFQNIEKDMDMELTLREARRRFEKEYIFSKLIANNWYITKTAKNLGMERTAFYRKMKELEIDRLN